MLEKEDELGKLFASFDDVVADGAPPIAPPNTREYTRARGLSMGSRLLAWVLRGPGLLLGFLFSFMLPVGQIQELLINTVGVLLVMAIAAPLLGKRPLSGARRWILVLILSSVFLTIVATLARCPTVWRSAWKSPAELLAISLCSVLQEVTYPPHLAWDVLAAVILLATARRLARAQPWVDTSFRPSTWRRGLSLAAVGLFVGLAVGTPLLYKAAWGQAWIAQASNPLLSAAPNGPGSLGDLGTRLPALPALADSEKGRLEVDKLTLSQFRATCQVATRYLAVTGRLTSKDRDVLLLLTTRVSREEPEPSFADFVWAVYHRANGQELDRWSEVRLRSAFHKHVVPAIAEGNSSPESLSLWQSRLASLPSLKRLSRREVDWLFLERFDDTRFQEVFGKRPLTHPLVLFGRATGVGAHDLSDRLEGTWLLLSYSHRRQHPEENGYVLLERLAFPFFGISDGTDMSIAFPELAETFPGRGFGTDRALLSFLLDLKARRLATGVYPATASALPTGFVYESHGKTARVQTSPSNTDTARHLRVDVTLR